MRAHRVRRYLRAVAAIGLAVALVPVATPGGVATVEASVVDGFTPDVPCDFSFNFWGFRETIANNDVYDRDARPDLSSGPLFTSISVTTREDGITWNDELDGWATGQLPLEYEAVVASPPLHAQSFTLNTDGTFTYVPRAGYFGADSFSYVTHLNNGPCSNIGVVTILPVTRVRSVDDTYRTTVDTPLEVGKFVCGVTCGLIDNDLLTNPKVGIETVSFPGMGSDYFVLAHLPNGTFRTEHGTVSRMLRNGSFVYTPNPGFEGTDTFDYTTSTLGDDGAVVSRGLGSHLQGTAYVAKVTIEVGPTVTDAGPRGTADEFVTDEDTPLVITSGQLRANDPAANYITSLGQMFFPGQVDIPTANGMLEVSWLSLVAGNPLSPQYVLAFTYRPNRDFVGVDTFEYTARLGLPGDASPGVPVSIRVLPTADPPLPQHDLATTPENVAITVDAAANDIDPDGDLVRSSLVEDPCTVNFCAPAGWLNERHGTWVVNGDGTITYTPDAGYIGSASFLYQVADEGGRLGYARVTVDVRANPAVDDVFTVAEDTQLVVAAPGVLANDQSSATSAEVVTPPSGTLSLNADGSFTYLPLPNAFGSDSFTYRAGGDLALVTIDVTPVADAPVLYLNTGCLGAEPSGEFVVLCFQSYDDRDVNEGEAATVRGRISDIETAPGILVVNWGDGSPIQNLPYPCTGAQCAVQIDTDQCWEGLGCQSGPLYFTLAHVYDNEPPGGGDVRFSVTAYEQSSGWFDTKAGFVRVRNTDVLPGAPTSVVPTVTGAGRVSVAFAPPASDGGAPITEFRVVCSSPSGTTRAAAGPASPLVVGGLSVGQPYTCQALAQNEVGRGPWSTASASVTPVGVPGTPTAITAVQQGPSRISVSFTAPGSSGGSPITGFRAVCTEAGVGGAIRAVTGTGSPIVVSGLAAGATYGCAVVAQNAFAWGVPSAAAPSVTMLATPAAPTGVSATVAGSGRLSVAFTAPADPAGAPVTSHRAVCRSGSGEVRSAAAAGSPVLVTGLTVGATYACTVVASNVVGAGQVSAESTGVVVLGAPGAPTDVTVTRTSVGRFSVSFTPPASDGGRPITSYRVVCTTAAPGVTRFAQSASGPITVALLTLGSTYVCRVSATNAVGTSPLSLGSIPTLAS